jgi:hypothetical protein
MRRNGPGQSSPLIRNLVYLWVAQNVWLVISSLLRLKLYVDEYQLSEMRVAAGIWMVLVAVGLVLIVAKIALHRSNKWLVTSNLAALAVTMWGVAVVDIQAIVAQHNVRHSAEMVGHGVPLDLYYMSELGPSAIPAIDEYLTSARFATEEQRRVFTVLRGQLTSQVISANPDTGIVQRWERDWREWSWRGERLANYLLAHPFSPVATPTIE